MKFFIPCYFGNEIQYDYSELLRDVHNIDWLKASWKHQRNFIILQENLKSKFQLRGAKCIPINLMTFLRIFQSAYSLYAVLRQIHN